MMKKWPILALTLALGVSAAVYAANDSEPAIVRRDNDAPLATSATSGAAESGSAPEAAAEAPAAAEPPAVTQTPADPAPAAETPAASAPEVPAQSERDPAQVASDIAQSITWEPDRVGYVSFGNLESRVRSSNLTVQQLEQTILSIREVDYDDMREDIRKALNGMADAQWSMVNMDFSFMFSPAEITLSTGQKITQQKAIQAIQEMSSSSAVQSLQSSYASLEDTYKKIKDGDLQEDNDAIIRQLQDAQDQVVMGAQSLYVAIKAMETQEGALVRQSAALDRTVQEMELRYELGQISALQLQQVKAGRTQLTSGIETLRMNIRTYKMQLENMIGANITGTIELGPLPTVTAAQLATIDETADLDYAMKASYSLFAAQRTLADAKDTYLDAGRDAGFRDTDYKYRAAKHTWEGAQLTYSNTEQSYRLSFRALGQKVRDYAQVLGAARVSLEAQRSSYAASEKKYELGNISKNALLAAQDELKTAEETVTTAQENLFSAWLNYSRARSSGLLNG